MCIVIQHLTYIHPDKEVLFQDISFSVNEGQKVALIGNNGSGKSTLMQVIGGRLAVSSGEIICSSETYYVPQHFGQYEGVTVAEALQIDKKIEALHAILEGDASVHNFTILSDDWNIEERALSALSVWGLSQISLSQPLSELSGGEKTKVFLSGINIHEPKIILMDEPTNHLDYRYREKLYSFIRSSSATMLIISHDRVLLNLLPSIFELSKHGIDLYGGNYEFYKQQKEQKEEAMYAKLDENAKQLRLAKKMAREAAERKQKVNIRSSKKSADAGIPRILLNSLKSKGENSLAKLKEVHNKKMESINDDVESIRADLPDKKGMKVDFNASSLHIGKILVTAKDINFKYTENLLWKEGLNVQIKSGDRILIKGDNGSGKTTFIKLLLGILNPSKGEIVSAEFKYVYLDQEYSIIDNNLTLYEQVQQFNSTGLLESEVKTILNRFLFPYETWDKLCGKLSGGEKMKLSLCCLMVGADTPDMLVLDEPTNNIDIQNIDILTNTIKDYRGTVLIISHDEYFASQVGIDYSIELG